MPANYAALEAARIARGGRDLTAHVPNFHDDRKPSKRIVSADGFRFTFGKKAYANGRGIGAMSVEKRREQSRKANAARWAK